MNTTLPLARNTSKLKKRTATIALGSLLLTAAAGGVGGQMATAAPSSQITSVPGSYKPAPATTGVPAGTKLTPYNTSGADLIITKDNTVLSGLMIYGDIKVRAKNVVIRDSYLRGGKSKPATNTGIVDANDAKVLNLVVSGNTIAPDAPSTTRDGVVGHDYKATNNHIYGTNDGLGIFNKPGGSLNANVTATGNYIHSLTQFVNDTTQPKATANDGIQVQGGRNINITGNNIVASVLQRGPGITTGTPSYGNSGITLQQNVSKLETVVVAKNWVDNGKASINIDHTVTKFPSIAVTVRENSLGRNQFDYGNGSKYVIRIKSQKASTVTGLSTNKWADNGTLLAVGRNSGIRFDDVASSNQLPAVTPTPAPTPTPTPTAPAVTTPAPTPTTPAATTPAVTAPQPTTGKPNATNTGAPAGAKLTPYNTSGADLIIDKDNTVLDGLMIYGDIKVRAKNVVIKNSHLRGGKYIPNSNTGIIDANNVNVQNLVVSNNTITPDQASYYRDGIVGHDYTATRNHIYRTNDGLGIFNKPGGSPNANVTASGNYIHDLTFWSNDPAHSDGTHNDGVQIQGGENIHLFGNTVVSSIVTGAGSAPSPRGTHGGIGIMIQQNVAKLANVVIEKNWVDDGQTSINIDHTAKNYANITVTVRGNYLGRNQMDFGNGSKYPIRIISQSASVVTGLTTNVWEDSGAFLAVGRDLGIRYNS
ncbi:hypothetical protein ACX80E_06945 [Arthrobacter sp. TMN-49]